MEQEAYDTIDELMYENIDRNNLSEQIRFCDILLNDVVPNIREGLFLKHLSSELKKFIDNNCLVNSDYQCSFNKFYIQFENYFDYKITHQELRIYLGQLYEIIDDLVYGLKLNN